MKTKTQKIQRAKIRGSFTNSMMANNATLPEVGKGATILHWSDRDAAEVVEVSEDGLRVKLESLSARYDDTIYKNGSAPMGHQNWILEPTGQFFIVVWRRGKWRTEREEITFTKEFIAKFEALGGKGSFSTLLTDEQREEIYKGDVRPQTVVEGVTFKRKVWSEIRILFGTKDYHYDWEF